MLFILLDIQSTWIMCDYLLGITRDVAFSFDSDSCVNFGDVNMEALIKYWSLTSSQLSRLESVQIMDYLVTFGYIFLDFSILVIFLLLKKTIT